MKTINKSLLGLAVAMATSGALSAETESNIESIVITSSSSEKLLSVAPASVSVITQEQIERRVVMDVTDALRGETGVNMSAVGFGRKGIEIRGMDADQTLVLIDGQRVGGSADLIAHSNYELSAIPASDIERIEVVRGPISALYGSDALGGVINIITKKVSQSWRTTLDAMGSQRSDEENTNNYRLGVSSAGSLANDKVFVRVAASQQYQGDVANADDPGLSDIEGNKRKNVRANVSWMPDDNQTIDASVALVDEFRWRDTVSRSTYYTYMDDIERVQLSLQHQGSWSWGESTMRLYRTEIDRENTRTAGISATAPSTISEEIVDGKVAKEIANHHVQAGVQWWKQNLKSEDVNDRGERQSIQKSLFIQDDWAIDDSVSLLLGGRFDHHDSYGWETSPRAYLVWSQGGWVVKGGYGEGFKAPSLKQLSPEYEASAAGGLFYIVGNPDLQPETNKAYELSVRYGTKSWHITSTLFRTDADDLIETFCVSGCDGRGAIRNYRNVAKSSLQGVELAASWDISDAFAVTANANYLDAHNDTDNVDLQNKPETSGYAELLWKPTDKITTQLRVEHVGEQLIDEDTLPSYQLMYVSASYKLTDNWRIQANIENLTDVYLLDESANFEFVEPGRTVSISTQLSF